LLKVDLRGAKIDDTTQIDDKWRLVWEIVNQGAEGRDLNGADLRGVDLGGANLRGANLEEANYNKDTVWPAGFDPEEAGAILLEEDESE
jgi:uncharacterized protein YjbI with pentapeptide repeats